VLTIHVSGREITLEPTDIDPGNIKETIAFFIRSQWRGHRIFWNAWVFDSQG